MKKYIFVVLSLIVHAQTSYIDHIQRALYHVETGFEKLLTDVVKDVEDTIHCTISAMEHILIINGILDKSSDYNKKCLGDAHPNTSTYNVRDAEHRRQIESSVYDKLPSTYNTGDFKNIVSKDIHSSLSNVNRTLHNILLKKGENDTRDDIFESLQHGTNRLLEVSNLLRRELEKISGNVRTELDKINFDQKSPEVSVRDEIQILRKVEKESNSSEVNEIHHVVESAINILKSNDDSNYESSNNQFEKIIKELKDADSNETRKSLQNYKQSKEHDANEINKQFLQISNVDNKLILAGKKEQNANSYESESPNYLSAFFSSFGDASDEKDAMDEAINLVKENSVANLFFKEAEHTGSNIFENPELFRF